MSRKEWCVHYRGMHQKEACSAGVAFASLEHYGTRLFHASCPCFSPDNYGRCDKREYPTAEQVAAHEAEMNQRFAKLGKARAAIVEDCGGPWKRGTQAKSNIIDCPVCGAEKSLQYWRAASNGHIHAGCKTEGCVRWME